MQTKADIRKQFKDTLGRNDVSDDLANTFIDQAISRIQRTLRVPPMERIAPYTVTFDQPSVILPDDFLSPRFFYAGEIELTYLPIGRFLAMGQEFGYPRHYTRVGAELKLFPLPLDGTELNLVYYGEIPDLIEDTDTNFLCAIAPDFLVYGALCFAADHFVDDRKAAFEDGFTRIYNELQEQALLVELEQGGMAIRPAYGTEY